MSSNSQRPTSNSLSNFTSNSPRRVPGENVPNRSTSSNASVPTNSGQGLVRNPSLRQGRALRKPTTRASNSFTAADIENEEDEDTKSINAQIITDLKEQVQRAEQASEQYRKQLEVMQKRFDDITTEQTAGEERDYQRQTELDHLRAELKDTTRQRREAELSYDSERRLILKDRERQTSKEVELQGVIHRLNETLRTKDFERTNLSRNDHDSQSHDHENDDPTTLNGEVSHYINALQDKDSAIEALRFDLAEAQLKLAEQEHMGDGRLQILEKQILETKMQNARLLEENESFQMLLSEKTLKGDFMPDHTISDSQGMSTLAEELESAGDEPEFHNDSTRKLESEMKTLRESNKALTLYIDKIIGRLLQHEGFEHVILDKDIATDSITKPNPPDKALPAIPQSSQPMAGTTSPPIANSAMTVAASGFLQRARSVVARPGGKARPLSYASPPNAYVPGPTGANENPDTAPSIPLNRGHRRARSDQAQTDLGAAAVVQQMNRNSPLRTASGGPLSPRLSAVSPQLNQGRPGYFSPNNEAVSQTSPGKPASRSGTAGDNTSSANSITSENSLERKSIDIPSIPRTSTATPPIIPGAVFKQNQLRPLRLVQQRTVEEEEAQKKANRGSWMGWLKGSSIEPNNE